MPQSLVVFIFGFVLFFFLVWVFFCTNMLTMLKVTGTQDSQFLN